MTQRRENPHGEAEITSETRIKAPLTHWLSMIALVLAVGFQGGYFVLKINALDEATERHREILDRLTLVAERLSIRQNRVMSDLSDAEQRIRDVEKRVYAKPE